MMKKTALNLIVYLFAGWAVNVAAQNKEPNILFIISDDHALQAINTYSGKYGITPNIDRIGKVSTAVSMDRNIGRILDYLDQHGLTENTLVVYTSDQGFYMGEHRWFDKRFMYEESMRMPLLMRYPGKIKAGTEINDLVVNIDFAPTLLSLGSVKVPENIQGKSLLPLMEGKRTEWRGSVYYHYYEYPDEHRVMPHFGIRTKRYKLIRFYGDGDFWELYDLSNDPREMNNLYPEKKYDKLARTLKEDLRKLINEYDDQEALEKMMDGK